MYENCNDLSKEGYVRNNSFSTILRSIYKNKKYRYTLVLVISIISILFLTNILSISSTRCFFIDTKRIDSKNYQAKMEESTFPLVNFMPF